MFLNLLQYSFFYRGNHIGSVRSVAQLLVFHVLGMYDTWRNVYKQDTWKSRVDTYCFLSCRLQFYVQYFSCCWGGNRVSLHLPIPIAAGRWRSTREGQYLWTILNCFLSSDGSSGSLHPFFLLNYILKSVPFPWPGAPPGYTSSAHLAMCLLLFGRQWGCGDVMCLKLALPR